MHIYGIIVRLTKGNEMEETDKIGRTQIIEPIKNVHYKGAV